MINCILQKQLISYSDTFKDPPPSIYLFSLSYSLTLSQCDQMWRNFATWANFKSIRQTFESLFSVWISVEPPLAKKYEFGQN